MASCIKTNMVSYSGVKKRLKVDKDWLLAQFSKFSSIIIVDNVASIQTKILNRA